MQCDEDNDGLANFNLNQAVPQITGSDPALSAPVFFRSFADADANTNSITNVTAFENTVNPVYARTQNSFGCVAISEVTLNVSNNSIVDPAMPLEECDTDANTSDGFFNFNLKDKESEILNNLPSGNVNYFTSMQDALSGLNAISDPNSFANTIPYEQTIYAKLSSGIDCYGIAQFKIIVNSFGNALNDEDAVICLGTPKFLDAGSGFSTYSWNTNPVQNTQRISVATAGLYSVTVTNAAGCAGTKTFDVTASNIATIASVSVNDFNGGNNSVSINLDPASIGDDYTYSIDGIRFQESPDFDNLASGEYKAYVRNSCGNAIPYNFFVMDYPKFFTPNGDGINEIWNIPYLSKQPKAIVSIFDRYGKLLYQFTGNNSGWNGQFEGKKLPATDYWFRISLQNGREVKGHFSLLR